jgi:hypothetical protein
LHLAWPARLEKFTCLGHTEPDQPPLALKTLWLALLPHHASLQSIRIASVGTSDPFEVTLPGVDFSVFETLKFLSLSYWTLGPLANCLDLLPPKLETFELTFDDIPDQPPLLSDFEDLEVGFLYLLTEAAVAKNVPLRRIRIVFTPRAAIEGPPIWERDVGLTNKTWRYPWDMMDELADTLRRRFGIELTYNKPSVDWEELDKMFEE